MCFSNCLILIGVVLYVQIGNSYKYLQESLPSKRSIPNAPTAKASKKDVRNFKLSGYKRVQNIRRATNFILFLYSW